MPVTAITSLEQFNEIINGPKPVIIDFWATWCGPCRVISPVLEKISDESAFEGIGFYKVDVDEQEDISTVVGVKAMPTFILFKDGQAVDKLVGANPQGLQELVKKGL